MNIILLILLHIDDFQLKKYRRLKSLFKLMVFNWIRRLTWKPKGKMYSLKCNQCGIGFLSSYPMDAPICGSCLQKVKSPKSTINYGKKCIICDKQGTVNTSEKCYDCYNK